MPECPNLWLGLALTSVVLLISVCLNIILYVQRRRASMCRNIDTEEHLFPQDFQIESFSQSVDEGHHFHNHNHHEHQENPIYGNINTDRDFGEECYEMMTKPRTTDGGKPREPDLNYASLDLNVAKKRRKKHRHQQGQTQDMSTVHNQPPAPPALPVAVFLEVEAEVEASLPPRNTSPMVSHNSIYLNSHQIAQETEERERERGMNMESTHMGWEGIRRREAGGSREWTAEREAERGTDRQDGGSVNIGAEIQDVDAIRDGTDNFINSFVNDNDQQH